MSFLMETENYIWNSDRDMLGKGASGSVYKARHKFTGEIVAVKVLNLPNQYSNQAYYIRAKEMHDREIEIMTTYKHKNIVELKNVQKLLHCRSSPTVIIMELCTQGSLHEILERPQNWKGLDETIFCNVLYDLASAMEFLKTKNIVHRDIKPLNIMCQMDDNGHSTFKLIDFGAARHLPDNCQFTSIVGTEEYLHPDIYKRGVVKEPNAICEFDECVDLWSIGVTLYHAAVGDLPFKPFEGVRKDHNTMSFMISNKPHGSISATQDSDKNITFSSELPEECNLSRGLKNLITPLLQGLLSSKNEGISFKEFFEIVKNIKQKIVFFVFDTVSSQIERVYANPNDKLVHLKEHIADLTVISSPNQILLYENLEIELMTNNKALLSPTAHNDIDDQINVSDFPSTTIDNPIFMFSNTTCPDLYKLPMYRILTEPYNYREDYPMVWTMHMQTLYCNHRAVTNLILRQRLIIQTAKMYQLWFDRKVGELKDDIVRMDSLLKETSKRIDLSMYYQDLVNLDSKKEETKRHFDSCTRQNDDLDKLRKEMEIVCQLLCENPTQWLRQMNCTAEDACMARISNALATLNKMKRVPDESKKYEKLEMERISDNCFNYISDHCIPRLDAIFVEFNHWYMSMLDLKKKHDDCLQKLEIIEKRHYRLITAMDKIQERCKASASSSSSMTLQIGDQSTMTSVSPMMTLQTPIITTPEFNFVIPRRSKTRFTNQLLQLKENLSQNNILHADIIRGVEENDRLLENLSIMTNHHGNEEITLTH